MPEYTLTYFDARGILEPARIILSYGGANWKDNRLSHNGPGSSMPADVKARTRFGQLPLLEIDGKQRLVQHAAIIRYLANQFKLTGKDDFEAAQCDEIVDAVRDYFQPFAPFFGEADQAKQAAGMKEAAENGRAKFLVKFDEIVKDNGGFMVGKGLTWADIYLTTMVYQIERVSGVELLTGLDGLAKLSETVKGTPGIKEWFAKRPDTRF